MRNASLWTGGIRRTHTHAAMAATLVAKPLRASSLRGVQSLINRKSRNHKNQQSGGSPQPAHGRRESIDLVQNLRLFLLHVRFRVAKVKLIVLSHRESAAIDQKDDQDTGQNAPRCQESDQWRHKATSVLS